MGAVCCGGRPQKEEKALVRELEKAPKDQKMGELGKEKASAFLVGSKVETDNERFDAAYAARDIAMMLKLTESTTKIPPLTQKLHPWASQPTTVGDLSATQLAILASRGDEEAVQLFSTPEGIERIVALLKDESVSKMHAAVLGLSYISDDPDVAKELAKTDAMDSLVSMLDSSIDGERAAAAQVCARIFTADNTLKDRFMELGGIPKLLALLTPLPDVVTYFTQLEAIYHIEDLCFPDGEPYEPFATILKSKGVVETLDELINIDNPDLQQAASDLRIQFEPL